jgi:6-pyruvoyltetrahydropterin/6-carboxytetrahydropterin synthase
LKITKRIEFDCGHRLPGVAKCSNLHGHRFALEVTLAGDAENGMIADFADVKRIVNEAVVERWDHAFLVWSEDVSVREFLATLPGHKTVITADIPTVENLARAAFGMIDEAMRKANVPARIEAVRLFETPNSWADFERKDFI